MNKLNKNENHKRAFIIWLAIYPLITLLYLLLGDYIGNLPLVLRTFVLTLIAVPLMFYIMVPTLNKVFSKWLRQ